MVVIVRYDDTSDIITYVTHEQGRIHSYLSRVRLGRGSWVSASLETQTSKIRDQKLDDTDGPTDRPTDRHSVL